MQCNQLYEDQEFHFNVAYNYLTTVYAKQQMNALHLISHWKKFARKILKKIVKEIAFKIIQRTVG